MLNLKHKCPINFTLKKNFIYFFCFYTKPKQPVNPIKDWVTLIVSNCVVIHGSLSLLDVLNNDHVTDTCMEPEIKSTGQFLC